MRVEIKSLTTEIRDLLQEVDEMEAAVDEANDVPHQLEEALKLEESALESVQATEADRTELSALQIAAAQTKVQQGVFERGLGELSSVVDHLEHVSSRPMLSENWPSSAGDTDMLSPCRARILLALDHLGTAKQIITLAMEDIRCRITEGIEATNSTDEASREIRRRLEKVEEGIGAITRRVEELREKSGQLSALRQRLAEKYAHAVNQVGRRDELYRTLDTLRQERFCEPIQRCAVAQQQT